MWTIDQTKILTPGEIARVLPDLKRRARRSLNSRQNLIVFRLATCCGLRVSELIGLRVGDVRVGVEKPYIHVRAEVAKRRKARQVPLWWDQGTLDDLTAWRDHRIGQGTGPTAPFVCSQSARSAGRPLDRQNARARFKVACRVLGADRTAALTIHHGRHTFASFALARGVSPVAVQQALGHSSLSITNVYAHLLDDDGADGNLFGTQGG
jgi:integrase